MTDDSHFFKEFSTVHPDECMGPATLSRVNFEEVPQWQNKKSESDYERMITN